MMRKLNSFIMKKKEMAAVQSKNNVEEFNKLEKVQKELHELKEFVYKTQLGEETHSNDSLNALNELMLKNGRSSEVEEVYCMKCFLMLDSNEGILLRKCLHIFCINCFVDALKENGLGKVFCPFKNDNIKCLTLLLQELEDDTKPNAMTNQITVLKKKIESLEKLLVSDKKVYHETNQWVSEGIRPFLLSINPENRIPFIQNREQCNFVLSVKIGDLICTKKNGVGIVKFIKNIPEFGDGLYFGVEYKTRIHDKGKEAIFDSYFLCAPCSNLQSADEISPIPQTVDQFEFHVFFKKRQTMMEAIATIDSAAYTTTAPFFNLTSKQMLKTKTSNRNIDKEKSENSSETNSKQNYYEKKNYELPKNPSNNITYVRNYNTSNQSQDKVTDIYLDNHFFVPHKTPVQSRNKDSNKEFKVSDKSKQLNDLNNKGKKTNYQPKKKGAIPKPSNSKYYVAPAKHDQEKKNEDIQPGKNSLNIEVILPKEDFESNLNDFFSENNCRRCQVIHTGMTCDEHKNGGKGKSKLNEKNIPAFLWECNFCAQKNSSLAKTCLHCNKLKANQKPVQLEVDRTESWICDGCKYKNITHKYTCQKCFELKEEYKNEALKQIPINKELNYIEPVHSKIREWKCKKCKIVKETDSILCVYCEQEDLKCSSTEKQIKSELELEQQSIKASQLNISVVSIEAFQWKCDYCLSVNTKQSYICDICSKIDEKLYKMAINQEEVKSSFKSKPNNKKINADPAKTWTCIFCTFVNLKEQATCEGCQKKNYPTKKFTFRCLNSECVGFWTHDGKTPMPRCPKCGMKNCLKCMAIHPSMNCEQYQNTDVSRIKCPDCGVTLRYDKKVGKLICFHCENKRNNGIFQNLVSTVKNLFSK